MGGKDPIARVHIINVLARFNTPEVQTALQGLLKDPNKLIRGATLSALQRMDGPIDIERVCALLREPEIDVQNKAIDVVTKANHPGHHPLSHRDPEGRERERAPRGRRGVERGREREVGEVPARGAEGQRLVGPQPGRRALGKIGGPRVIDAVAGSSATRTKTFVARPIEILNQTKTSARADSLIQATHDTDWGVSERAVDALAEIGSKRAVPRLTEMLQSANAGQYRSSCGRWGKLGDSRLVETLLPFAARPEREVRIEAIQALSKIVDERHVDQLRGELQTHLSSPDQTIARIAHAALAELQTALSGGLPPQTGAGTPTSAMAPTAASAATDATGGTPGRSGEDPVDVRSGTRPGRETGGIALAARHQPR